MYIIKKTEEEKPSMWDKEWEKANVANIALINWSEFDYAPNTTAKILYSDYGLYVQLMTDEKPLVAKRREQNSDVCEESCMEFFFRPNENDERYMNFEFNPFGTMYYGVRYDRYNFEKPEVDKKFFEVQSYVDEKIWIIQFTMPFAYIDKVLGGHTKNMYGNIYKCGSETEQEHYLTLYPINTEKPDFHRPEAFGLFVLE